MTMNKKFSLSKVTVIMLLLMVVMVLYCFLYMLPAQNELTAMRAELSVANAEASIYRQYLTDISPLENDIAEVQAEIDKLHAEGYINDSNVSFEISDAVQRYQMNLTSVTLGNVTTVDEHRALPINVTMSGELENVLRFISHFENDKEGSYLVQGATIELSGTRATVALTMYLCTPNV